MTQAKLLDIAIREFGAKGLDGASTRGIAAAAGTAMSSITYHYGGKEGLYLAAADHIAAAMAQDMAPAVVAERDVGDDDPAAARAAIKRILDRFTVKMATYDSADWGLFIAREQLRPTAAFDRLYAGMMGQMLERLVTLTCTATGQRDRDGAVVTALALFGQVAAIRTCRGTALRLLRLEELTAAIIDAWRHRVAVNIDAALDAMIAE